LAQTRQAQVSQQEEMIRHLQVKLNFVESQVIDIGIFQSQAIEIRKRVSVAQEYLLAKMEAIQNHCQTIGQALKDISLREREDGVARVAFQEVVIDIMKKDMVNSSRLSIPKKTRGNILFKAWERNISKNRE
jgi:hypothetical protein